MTDQRTPNPGYAQVLGNSHSKKAIAVRECYGDPKALRRLDGSPSQPGAQVAWHASVVIVNPGGTGNPKFVISALFAPLPPNKSFRSLVPSMKA
jgi:hypothetical protein